MREGCARRPLQRREGGEKGDGEASRGKTLLEWQHGRVLVQYRWTHGQNKGPGAADGQACSPSDPSAVGCHCLFPTSPLPSDPCARSSRKAAIMLRSTVCSAPQWVCCRCAGRPRLHSHECSTFPHRRPS